MASKRPNERDGNPSTLDAAIVDLNLANETTNLKPVKAVFDSASVLLTLIRVGFLPARGGRILANVRRTQRSEGMIASSWG